MSYVEKWDWVQRGMQGYEVETEYPFRCEMITWADEWIRIVFYSGGIGGNRWTGKSTNTSVGILQGSRPHWQEVVETEEMNIV